MDKIALLFPGQGSQYTTMGKKFYERYEAVKNVFSEASDVLGIDIKKLCFEGDMKTLTKTSNAQPAILTVSVAMFKAFMEEYEAEPALLCGHSLGEISALTCSGAIKITDAIKIVRRRGELFEEAVPQGNGSLAAVDGVDVRVIKSVLSDISKNGKYVSISCYNLPQQIVIGGEEKALNIAKKLLIEKGAKVSFLKVSAPFHTNMMISAAEELANELAKYTYSHFRWPVISNVDAKPYNESRQIIENLKKQVTYPVLWNDTMDYIEKNGVKVVVEIGPQAILRNLMKKAKVGIEAFSFDKTEDREKLNRKVKFGLGKLKNQEDINKESKKHEFIKKCIAIAVCTRNSNWKDDEYIKGVVEPLKKVKHMYYRIEEECREPENYELKEAIMMVLSVLHTKRISDEEREKRLEELLKIIEPHEVIKDFEYINYSDSKIIV